MSSEAYYSKSTRINSPTFQYGIAKIIGGVIFVIIFLPDLFEIPSFMQRLNVASDNTILYGLIKYGIAVIVWLVGFKMIFNGLKNLKKLTITPELPPSFNNYERIKDSIISGKLEIYRLPKSGPLKRAYNYISDKIPFLTPLQREVVSKNMSFLNKYIFLVITIIVLSFISSLLPRDFYRELSVQPIDFSIPYLFLIYLLIILVISIFTIFLLVPGNIPKQQKSEDIATINGGGDPNTFCSILEKAFLDLRFNELPNRIFKTGFKKNEELNFNDTGSFEGLFAIETHPKYLEKKGSNVYLIYLVIAIITLSGSLFYLKQGEAPRLTNSNTFLSILGKLFLGIVLFQTALNFYKRAFWLLNTYSFESIFAVVDVEGTIGKTEITAGKAITDSLETKNTVIRSDSQLRVYTTKLLTESYYLSGNRYITAMIVDHELNSATNKIMDAINNFRDEGVAVRGIDIKSGSLNNITQANLLLQEAKKKGKDIKSISNKQKAVLEPPKEKKETKHEEDSELDANHKECPRCAEIIKSRAKVCRYCGHEFE